MQANCDTGAQPFVQNSATDQVSVLRQLLRLTLVVTFWLKNLGQHFAPNRLMLRSWDLWVQAKLRLHVCQIPNAQLLVHALC